jgi:P27 family predicted phage terminase small subunit
VRPELARLVSTDQPVVVPSAQVVAYMRGRKPTPTVVKNLLNNPGKRPVNQDEPQPDAIAPDPPDWLNPRARAHWLETAPELESLGLLTAIDGSSLAEYCTIWARWQEAEEAIRTHGMVVRVNVTQWDKNGKPLNGSPATSPYVNIANKSLAHVRAFEVEFGRTPSSRSRVHVKGKTKKTSAQKFADNAPKLRLVK